MDRFLRANVPRPVLEGGTSTRHLVHIDGLSTPVRWMEKTVGAGGVPGALLGPEGPAGNGFTYREVGGVVVGGFLVWACPGHPHRLAASDSSGVVGAGGGRVGWVRVVC